MIDISRREKGDFGYVHSGAVRGKKFVKHGIKCRGKLNDQRTVFFFAQKRMRLVGFSENCVPCRDIVWSFAYLHTKRTFDNKDYLISIVNMQICRNVSSFGQSKIGAADR